MTAAARWARLEVPSHASLDLALPDTYDFLADEVLILGKHFPPHFELALAFAPPDAVVVDLGAHFGTFALAAAANGHRVIAVEASPRNVELLGESAHANGLEDAITIVSAAVSNRSGTVRFRQAGAWGQVTDSWSAGDIVEVPARTVTEILAGLAVARVDVVKMDVEGSELAAIEGMADLLARANAPAVVYENNAHTLRMFGATPEQLVGALADFGYKSYLIDREERELAPVTRASFQPETIVDYAAVKGTLAPPPGWSLLRPRTDSDLARAVSAESLESNVDLRAQLARSLSRAPASLLARRDVQLTLTALALDPDDTVARAAAWSVRPERHRGRRAAGIDGVRQRFHELGDQGRALRDRLGQIRIRWGARP
jgi:FkbM family methyltransferase